MALLAESLLPPAAPARGRRVGAPSILGALLLHGGAALAMLLLAQHSLPVPAVEIEVIWPTPQPAPVPTSPAAAEPAAETLPVPQAMPEPEPEPEPLPDPLAAEPPPPTREKPKPPSKPVVKPAPAPQPVQEMSAPAPTLTEAPPTAAVTPAAQAVAPATAEPVQNAPPAAPRDIKPQEAAPPASPYNAILLDWLRRHMEYPRAARLRRQQGEVRLKLELDRGGRLLAASLATSSTHAILDEAALSMAQRAAPYPPPLDLLGQQRSVVFIVPLRFELTP
ncbi:TonB family protein [Ferrovibrio sp. MS7]|uniref:energy transducer TonB n=1 Tax=Ferrovibrio plantarum TaxID=3119164 RepID=UPI0031347093